MLNWGRDLILDLSEHGILVVLQSFVFLSVFQDLLTLLNKRISQLVPLILLDATFLDLLI